MASELEQELLELWEGFLEPLLFLLHQRLGVHRWRLQRL